MYVSGTSLVMKVIYSNMHTMRKFGLAVPGELCNLAPMMVVIAILQGSGLRTWCRSARNLAAASEAGIPTILKCFNKDTALQIVKITEKQDHLCKSLLCAY